jgi:hypothetical protein
MRSSIVGASSELQCAYKLVELGWAVAFPFTHDHPFDMIIYKDGELRTIQVKGTEYAEHQKNVIKGQWDRYKDIDFIILHDRVYRSWYIFKKGELKGRRSITLDANRLQEKHNNWKLIK